MRGRDFRMMRRKQRITQKQLRAALGWDMWKLVRIENEDVLPTPEDEALIVLKINELTREGAAA